MIELVKMSEEHRRSVIDIFNHYVENSFSAFPESPLPYQFFDRFREMTKNHPAYVILEAGKVLGFGFLRPYNPFPTFSKCAEISYFIAPGHSGKGLGSLLLDRLEKDASEAGINVILAEIASENHQSLDFHRKNGFIECGRFPGILFKKGLRMDVVWMAKRLFQVAGNN